ncbi:glucose-6-phosphate dehydrogenase, partial [Thermodesulfobacteriota bacterium]
MDMTRIDEYTDQVIKANAPDLAVPRSACLVDGAIDPCGIVIFGATGDLTSRKLAPAIYNLFETDTLPDRFFVLGAARSKMSNDSFRLAIRESLNSRDLARWDEFARRLYYQAVAFDSQDSFDALATTLQKLAQEHNTNGNKLIYLALPPSLYGTAARMLGQAGSAREGEEGAGWARIVIEKPFGRDLKSSIQLNSSLQEYFSERQIYRIDHYLAKETVQNVLVLRFANAIFEPLWNRNYIDHVRILAVESLGVLRRASYYEEAGVLRDMFQNHMMQLLALTAMEPPASLEADRVRDEKVKVFRSLRPFTNDLTTDDLLLGQYGPGVVDGEDVVGYREEQGVRADSTTPTFGMMRVFLENWRWKGVPFYLVSGKRLVEKRTEISIYFKSVP